MTNSLLSTKQFEGVLLGRSGDFLIGWVRDIQHQNDEVSVELFGDGIWLATSRAGLTLACLDEGWVMPLEANGHGFVFNLQLCHWLSIARFEVRVSNHDYSLAGVVFTYAQTMPTSRVLSSHVDYHGGLRLWGVAWEALDPGAKLKIFAYEGERLLAETIADKQYAEHDIGNADIAKHGFSITLPIELADGEIHQIRIVTEKGQVIDGSPVDVCVPATSLGNWVKGLPLKRQDSILMDTLMERYAWHVPVSVDFSCYAAWFQRFGNPKKFPCSTESILVAVAGDGDVSVTLQSLVAQSHPHWTALVCGAVSSTTDPRIQVVESKKWLKQLRKAMSKGAGIVTFIKAGDTVTEDALTSLVYVFQEPKVKMAYSDCDQVSADGTMVFPWFKPNWDPDLFLSATPLHHLFATRLDNLPINNPQIGEIDAWPWLAVQAVGDDPNAIHHIPRILYHRAQQALQPRHADAQRACDAVLAPGLKRILSDDGNPTMEWVDLEVWPKVSAIIPTRDHADLLKKCVESLLQTDYPDLEIIVIDNDTAEPEALEYLDALQTRNIKVIRYPGVFNYSAINNRAVQLAQGTVIALINNDIEVIDIGWLKAMVRQLARPNVGAVGAKLIWPNEMVQHAGVVLGLHGLVGHIGNDWHKDDAGYLGYNRITRSVSAVTAACLLCKREDYDAVGGLDETDFPINFNDVDFCLKLRKSGKRIVWTADAQLIHAESVSRGSDNTPAKQGRLAREQSRLMQKWRDWIMDDPYYNPNLNLDVYSHAGLAVPPRKALGCSHELTIQTK